MIVQLLAIAASLAVLGTLVSLVLQWRARIATERRIEALREIHRISPPTRSYRFPEPLNENAEAPAVTEPQPVDAQPPVVAVKKAEVASSKPVKTPAAAKPKKPTLAKEKPAKAKAKARVVNNKRDDGRRQDILE